MLNRLHTSKPLQRHKGTAAWGLNEAGITLGKLQQAALDAVERKSVFGADIQERREKEVRRSREATENTEVSKGLRQKCGLLSLQKSRTLQRRQRQSQQMQGTSEVCAHEPEDQWDRKGCSATTVQLVGCRMQGSSDPQIFAELTERQKMTQNHFLVRKLSCACKVRGIRRWMSDQDSLLRNHTKWNHTKLQQLLMKSYKMDED